MKLASVATPEYLRTAISRVPERPERTAEIQAIECLKYLCIMSLTKGRRIAVTPEVDDIWHELIVQTKSYKALCEALPGQRFVHHESITPAEYEKRVGSSEFVDEFLKWIPEYVQSFGPFTEETGHHWTIVGFLQDHVGMPLEEINELGANSPAEALLSADSPWRSLGKVTDVDSLSAV